jgi:hypothetical protein
MAACQFVRTGDVRSTKALEPFRCLPSSGIRAAFGNRNWRGTTVTGPFYGKWVNVKVAFTAATLSSVVYINNCMKGTITKGTRRDGDFYFKQGVYHCADAAGCRDSYKNIHFFRK